MRILLMFVLVAMAVRLRAGEIDRLKGKRDVERFVKRLFPKLKKEKIFLANTGDTGALANQYVRLDLNGDGLTDLVVNGKYVLVVLDRGGEYVPMYLSRLSTGLFDRPLSKDSTSLLSIDSSGRPIKLVLRQKRWLGVSKWSDPYLDTLVVHYGQLMEYNEHPDTGFSLQSITIKDLILSQEHNLLFGVTIGRDRKASCQKLDRPELYMVIPERQFDSLTEILRYISPGRLDSTRWVLWSMLPRLFLEIRYNGKICQVVYQEELGPYGLQRLYELLARWAMTLEWKENQ